MSTSEWIARRERILEALPDGSILILFSGEAAVASRDTTLPFWVQRSFYYLTGLDREGMILCLRRNGQQRDCMVWTLPKDPDREKWTGMRMTKEAITEQSGIVDVRDVDGFYNEFPAIALGIDSLYLDLDRLTWNASASRQELFAAEVRAGYPHLTIRSAAALLTSLRLIKSALEVNHLRKAIAVTWD
ncbi:MAG: aminopeptidase P N-terminal domain-containing protein, partial [Firmicutes bacterium]|nr:aminopeptidase P N-terminal domain-containing protein [Bacillota bacterium]